MRRKVFFWAKLVNFFHPPDAHSIVAHIFLKGGHSKFSQIGAKKQTSDYSNSSH